MELAKLAGARYDARMPDLNTKTCTRCEQDKPRSDFGPQKRPDGKVTIRPMCRLCWNAYLVERRQSNESARLSHNRIIQRSKKRLRDEVATYKAVQPCTDCGGKFHSWQLQFDHVPGRGEKIGEVSRLKNNSRKRLWEEIKKCEVVCANCHAHRTYLRGLGEQGSRRFCKPK